MHQSDIEKQVIQEITDHKSLAVMSYKHASNKQHEFASNTIFGNY